MCYQIRAETFNPEIQEVLKLQSTPVSVNKIANPLPDMISKQRNASTDAAAKEIPKACERYFHFKKRAILTIEDVREVGCMDTFLYPQQLPVDATEGVMIIIDPVLSSVYSKWQREPTHCKSGSAPNDKSSPGLSWIPAFFIQTPAKKLIAVTPYKG